MLFRNFNLKYIIDQELPGSGSERISNAFRFDLLEALN